ncbi:unnamed protein product [Didymodactylos carnosus]|uniref:Baseplate structural protein Gp10 C-terminal domain-containing protein n=1 Tax=Didymodactylos carnosus TaxID=1234261 RepID=A0A815ISP4_9BILA|nr:unnamed protein product [Didymodactylos carnosus]CAF1372898.1 unnamed protein product [Didymodactylos carnosus]CAF4033291.1 unnamed protein product [Didymodactylos carnosus]CAF4260786.1 unnamed protein product [Didymodactylos carnosus]
MSLLCLNSASVIEESSTKKEETGVNVEAMLKEQRASISSSRLSTPYPRGMIVMIASLETDNWFTIQGNGIGEYTGWYICDGRNGTPDLRGRFLVGRDVFSSESDYSDVGKIGGTSRVQLSENQMPSHTHTDKGHSHTISLSTGVAGSHAHDYDDIFFSEHYGNSANYVSVPRNLGSKSSDHDNVGHQMRRTTYSAGNHQHNIVGNTLNGVASIAASGGNQSHENRPPYYVVIYIVYLGV